MHHTTHLVSQIPAGPTAATTARRLVERFGKGMSAAALGDAKLLVTELVTNSVRHGPVEAGSIVRLAMHLDAAALHVEVTDHGAGFTAPPAAVADAGATSGRGLQILDMLAEDWRIEARDGTCVSFDMALMRAS